MDEDSIEELMDCDKESPSENLKSFGSKDSNTSLVKQSSLESRENGIDSLNEALKANCVQIADDDDDENSNTMDSKCSDAINPLENSESNEASADDALSEGETKDMASVDVDTDSNQSSIDADSRDNLPEGDLETSETNKSEDESAPSTSKGINGDSEATEEDSSKSPTTKDCSEPDDAKKEEDVTPSEKEMPESTSEETQDKEHESSATESKSEANVHDDVDTQPEEDTLSKQDQQETDDDKSGDETGKNGPVKIKLRSFASLCDGSNQQKGGAVPNATENATLLAGPMTNIFSSEISGVSVGDIVQHGNIVESDESGVMHLKISNVVGGEDCITGLIGDEDQDVLPPIQISSITSLIEPLSPEDSTLNEFEEGQDIVEVGDAGNKNDSISLKLIEESKEKTKTIIKILRCPLVVSMSCSSCQNKTVCKFRVVAKSHGTNKVSYLCSDKCKETTVSSLPDDHIIEKPRLYFEKLCGMCGKDMTSLHKNKIFSWQTREFCNKLCLADHIGEVARSCFCCVQPVRVLFMVKYCVRFGSDVHQFCSNNCLEQYKSKITVCCYCQKNLLNVEKVISPTNKEYCSEKCLKRAQRRDIGQQHYTDKNDCTVCNKNLINKFEFVKSNSNVWLCSDPCLNVYKYVNQVKSVNCCLCARLLNAEDSPSYFFNGRQLRVFCADSCLSVFIISSRKIVTCNYCKVKKYNFDMIGHFSSSLNKDVFYCSICCLNFVENKFNKENTKPVDGSQENDLATKNSISLVSPLSITQSATTKAVPSSGPPGNVTPILKECNMCSKVEPAQFHMVMSDSTLRSFCSYICATRYKCTFGFLVSGGLQALHKALPASPSPVDKDTTMDKVSKIETPVQPTPDINKGPSKPETKDLLSILKLFEPPAVFNKSTMCHPINLSKAVQCKPCQCEKEVQTDESKAPIIIPIPIPIYVPTPMMMYSASVPVPLVIPLPIPVPVFIPTTEKTTEDIMRRIKEIKEMMPSDLVESEMLLLAKEAEAKAHSSLDAEGRCSLSDKDDSRTPSGKKDSPSPSDTEDHRSPSDTEDHQSPSDREVLTPKNKGDSAEDVTIPFDKTELGILATLDDALPKTVPEEQGTNSLTGTKRKASFDSDSDSENFSKKPRLNGDEEDEKHEQLNTYYGLLAWKLWVRKKDTEALENMLKCQEDLLEMNSDVLSRNLILFLKDLKRPDGQDYEIDTTFYLLLALQKHLFEKGSTHCIFLENNFDEFTCHFNELIRTKLKSFLNSEKIERRLLSGTRITEEMMWEARQLGVHTPHVLLNTLFYFNTKIFKLKTPLAHLKLTFSKVHKQWVRSNLPGDASYNMMHILKFTPGDKDEGTSYEMVENKENPVRCPVKLYGFYMSKCPESVRNCPCNYYVYPEQSCLADSPVWFSTVSVDLGTLEKMLNRILLVKEVQEALAE